MPLKSEPYHWLECDRCGARAEYGEFSALQNPGQAIDDALDDDWTTDGMEYHCPACPALALCEACGKPAGENAPDRDGCCQACWDKAEAAGDQAVKAGATAS